MTGRVLLAGAALIVLGGPIGIGLLVAAEQEPATERFEVATIRPNTGPAVGGPIGGGIGFRTGRFSAENITLQQLLIYAYQMQAYEIFGGPDWVTRDRFDIAATMPSAPAAADPGDASARNRRLIRTLLADRFSLVVHEERREMPVYSLVVARPDRRLGARLRPFEGMCTEKFAAPSLPAQLPAQLPAPSKDPIPCILGVGVGRLSARGMALSDLSRNLATFAAIRRRVIDRTGLTGRFDYDLEWTPIAAPAGVPVPNPSPDGPPDIFTALQDQLGLKLESTNETVSVLVIDSVNQPSPN